MSLFKKIYRALFPPMFPFYSKDESDVRGRLPSNELDAMVALLYRYGPDTAAGLHAAIPNDAKRIVTSRQKASAIIKKLVKLDLATAVVSVESRKWKGTIWALTDEGKRIAEEAGW